VRLSAPTFANPRNRSAGTASHGPRGAVAGSGTSALTRKNTSGANEDGESKDVSVVDGMDNAVRRSLLHYAQGPGGRDTNGAIAHPFFLPCSPNFSTTSWVSKKPFQPFQDGNYF